MPTGLPPQLFYDDFYANTTNFSGFAYVPNPTNLFVNPLVDLSLRLTAASPMIDAGARSGTSGTRAGVITRDIDGEPRPMAGPGGLFKYDIGADEWTGPAQTTRDLGAQPADFTLIGPGGPLDNEDSLGTNDWIGYSVLGGDLNGDGRDDLMSGAPNHSDDFDGGVNDSGRVYALYNNGTRRLGVYDLFTDTASLEVRSWLHQQHIGSAFAAVDLNGGGTKDLVIGSVGGDNNGQPVTGTAYSFAGGAALTGTRTLSPTMQADWRFKSRESTQTYSGNYKLAAGQVNGSGPGDLLLGEPLATGPGNRIEAGAVYGFFGSNSLPPLWDLRSLPASLTVYGPAAGSQLGQVATGDVNGDGAADVVARSLGAMYVFYGPRAGGVHDLATTPADATVTGLGDGLLVSGDVDGDSKADLVVSSGARVVVVRGGTLTAMQTITQSAWSSLTTGISSALHTLDWNGDGASEIVIGDRVNEQAFVLFGGSGLQGTSDVYERARWVLYGEDANDQFAFSAGGGDFDADGAADLMIGARAKNVSNHSNGFNDAGAVYVLYGSLAPKLAGHVNWQGRPAQPHERQQAPVTLTLKLGSVETDFTGMTTDASGYFTVPLGSLTAGTYNWRVKGPKYLANSGQVTLAGGPLTVAEMGLMRAADANNDNVVAITDFNILRITFGKVQGDPGYDDRADFTGDLAVNISDFNLLRVNFGVSGAPPLGQAAP